MSMLPIESLAIDENSPVTPGESSTTNFCQPVGVWRAIMKWSVVPLWYEMFGYSMASIVSAQS